MASSGRCNAADGLLAAGAVVWTAKISHGAFERQEIVADANGRYTVALDLGSWSIRVQHSV